MEFLEGGELKEVVSRVGVNVTRSFICLLPLFLLTFSGCYLSAEEKKQREGPRAEDELPIKVTSQEFIYRGDEKKGFFKGDVKVEYGSIKVSCDELEVFYNPETKAVERVIGRDKVKIESGNRSGEGEEVDFLISDQKVILKGQPRLKDGVNMMKGELIRFSVQDGGVDCYRCSVAITSEVIRSKIEEDRELEK